MLLFIRRLFLIVWYLLANTLVMAFYIIRPRHPSNSYVFTKLFSPLAAKIYGLKFKIENEQQLIHSQPCVYISNHQHTLDVVTVGMVHPPRTISIGKTSIRWIPFFGLLYYLAGNLFIDRKKHIKAMRTMSKAQKYLTEKKISFLIFPEGTRSHGKGLMPFKKGPFVMAVDAQVPIQPFVVSSVQDLKLNNWHAGTVFIKALTPIPTKGLNHDHIESLVAQAHLAMKAELQHMHQKSLQ